METDTFTFQDLVDHMAEAKAEGYGHAYLHVDDDLHITWGMCGSKTTFPDSPHGGHDTWVSPFVQSGEDKSVQQVHQDAWGWLQNIKAGLGFQVFTQMYRKKGWE